MNLLILFYHCISIFFTLSFVLWSFFILFFKIWNALKISHGFSHLSYLSFQRNRRTVLIYLLCIIILEGVIINMMQLFSTIAFLISFKRISNKHLWLRTFFLWLSFFWTLFIISNFVLRLIFGMGVTSTEYFVIISINIIIWIFISVFSYLRLELLLFANKFNWLDIWFFKLN